MCVKGKYSTYAFAAPASRMRSSTCPTFMSSWCGRTTTRWGASIRRSTSGGTACVAAMPQASRRSTPSKSADGDSFTPTVSSPCRDSSSSSNVPLPSPSPSPLPLPLPFPLVAPNAVGKPVMMTGRWRSK